MSFLGVTINVALESVESFPDRVLGTMRCSFCGQFHEVNEDGVVEGMCEAERARKP